MILPDGLLDDARNYLDITWNDPAGEKKLTGILMRGMAYLNEKAGVELDFSKEDSPRSLLFDYTRYVRANALDEFEGNYLHDLLSLQIREQVKEAVTVDSEETTG